MIRALILVLLATLAAAAPAGASVWVSPAGDDARCADPTDSLYKQCRTISMGAALVEDGQSVYVQCGTYPKATIVRDFTARTTIRGGCGVADGITLDGASNLLVWGVQSTYLVHVNNSQDVELRGQEITDPGAGCMKISGSTDILVTGAHIHDCGVGIVGSSLNDSFGVTIQDSTIEDIDPQDGIQATHWHDVVIQRNTIRGVRDSAGIIHNDGIQTAGDATNWLVQDNDISDIRGQGMLLQRTQLPFGPFWVLGNTIYNDPPYHSLILSGATGNIVAGNWVCAPRGSAGVKSLMAYGADGASLEVYDNHFATPWQKGSDPLLVLRDDGNVAC